TSGQAEAFWDHASASAGLTVTWENTPVFTIGALPPRAWIPLSPVDAEALQGVLRSTSILTVHEQGGQPGLLLVQEEGMHGRPPFLVLELTPAEILRYWSLLTVAQRAEFLNARAPELAQTDEGSE